MDVFDLVAKISLDSSSYDRGLETARKGFLGLGNSIGSSSIASQKSLGKIVTKATAVGQAIGNVFNKAAGAVMSSMGSAVSRVDTLNSYSKVMTSLGYSSDQASASMKKLSDGIQGLPTTLPGIVTMQQQFAALTGDMDSATDVTLALNDAVVSGGQSTEVANSALNQWYQIIANGKPDLQSWRIINSAMPAQLNAIAEECVGAGAKAQDLFTAWQKGSVTTDQVLAAVKKLDKEGGEGFQSFAEQAQSASGGIATSFQNVKTKIATVVANVIQAMTDGGLSISGILDQVKSSIGDLGNKAVELVGKADWADVSNKISSAIAGITKAIVSIDWETVITTAITLLQALANVISWIVTTIGPPLASAIQKIISFLGELVEDIKETCGPAFKALGDALSNLGGAFLDVAGKMLGTNSQAETTQKIANVLKKIIEELTKVINFMADHMDTLLPTIVALTKAFVALKTAMMIKDTAKSVVSNFKDIKEKAGELIGGSKLIQKILPTSSASRGGDALAGMFDAATKEAGPLEKAIDGTKGAFSSLGSIITGTVLPAIGGLLTNPVTWVIAGIAAAIVAVILVIKNWGKISKWFGGVWDKVTDGVKSATDKIGGFFGGIKDKITGSLKDAYSSATTSTDGFLGDMRDAYENSGGGLVGTFEAYATGIKEGLDFIVTAFGNLFGIDTSAISNKINEIWISVTNFVDKVIETIEGIPGKIANLFVNIGTTIGDFLTSLPGKIMDFLNKLPGYAGYVSGQVVGTITKIGVTVVEWIATNVPIIVENVVTFLKELPGKILEILNTISEKIGEFFGTIIGWIATNVPLLIENVVTFLTELPGKIWDVLTSVIEKLGEWAGNVISWVSETVPTIIDSIVNFFAELPGKIWDWLQFVITYIITWGKAMIYYAIVTGQQFLSNIVSFFSQLPGNIWNWLTTTISNVASFVSEMGSKALEAGKAFFSNLVGVIKGIPKEMVSIGKNIVKGIWEGISSMFSWIKGKIKSFADGFSKGFKDALGIHSPSKVFAGFGKYSVLGYVKGWEDNIGSAVDDMKASLDLGDIGSSLTMGAIAASPQPQVQGASNSSILNAAPITINVYGAEGQDVRELADVVADRINMAVERERAAFA